MAASDRQEREKDGIKRFDPRILDRSVIAIPLLEEINKDDNEVRAEEGAALHRAEGKQCEYVEDSGTSIAMA